MSLPFISIRGGNIAVAFFFPYIYMSCKMNVVDFQGDLSGRLYGNFALKFLTEIM